MAGAARAEGAARRHGPGLRHGAGNGVERAARPVDRRQGGQQPVRVGMQRGLEQALRGGLLDHPPGIEDADALAGFPHHAEVVADQHQRHAGVAADLRQQFQDLRLDGDVQRGGRLVRHQQLRLAGERHGDHHALVLPARQLVRIGIQPPPGVGHADPVEQPLGLGPGGPAGHAAMQGQHLGDLPADAVDGVQAARRVLEDHGDAAAAHPVQHRRRGAQDLLAIEPHAAGDARLGRQQAQGGQPGDRLAAAGFTHQGQGFAAPDGEVHAAQGGRAVEADGEVADLDQGLPHVRPSSCWRGTPWRRPGRPSTGCPCAWR
ncbi:hypothetical protein ROTAS13_01622 [Roseomonas sp. TAS13]|nr:hypothetical protein ROTAS13_01622 [Roseomonas sp. TAS13]